MRNITYTGWKATTRFIQLNILIIVGLLILSGCSDQTVTEIEKFRYNEEKIQTLESLRINEETFLFKDDMFTIIFPYSLDFLNKIKEVRFFFNEEQTDTISNEDTPKISLNENKIIFNEESPINDFNRIEVLDLYDQVITLNTGLYSFDNSVKYSELPEGKESYQRSSHFRQEGQKIIMTFSLTNTPDSKIRFRLPYSTQDILVNPSTTLLTENDKSSSYQFVFFVNQSYLLNNDLNNVSFELIVEQQYRGLHHVISKSFIPIDAQSINNN
ncbi:hypothetical protein [Paenibacillus sp. GCM10012306]|uniref:hypothetical protein n=1 Tax=Paenibacillus sp. GCM10012306 TaxID=3317342 RepID=UPI00361F1350